MRRHQYYLKDSYKPVIRLLNVDHPHAQFYDWTSDAYYWITPEEWQQKLDRDILKRRSCNLADYETRERDGQLEIKWVVRRHVFDWENVDHVRALINNYYRLNQQMADKLDTYGYTLLLDF